MSGYIPPIKIVEIGRAGDFSLRRHLVGAGRSSFLSVVDASKEVRDNEDWYGRFEDTPRGIEAASSVCSALAAYVSNPIVDLQIAEAAQRRLKRWERTGVPT